MSACTCGAVLPAGHFVWCPVGGVTLPDWMALKAENAALRAERDVAGQILSALPRPNDAPSADRTLTMLARQAMETIERLSAASDAARAILDIAE